MKERVFIFVNGVLTWPGKADNWNGKAVTHVMSTTPHKAEKMEYLSGLFFSRSLFQRSRARHLRKVLSFWHGPNRELILVGHSNGCDVILDALDMSGWPKIHHIHFISAACSADFKENGLNAALKRGSVGGVTNWIAGKDWALKFTKTFTARFLFGYGTLGRTGPENVDVRVADRVLAVTEPDFGHSTWFSEKHFRATMDRILATE